MNGCEVYFSATLSLVSPLSDRKVPNDFDITHTVLLQCPISAEISAVDSQSDLRILNFVIIMITINMLSEFHILKRITTEFFQPIMALTKPLIPVWIFMLEAFGRDRDLHFSMFGCVTQRRLLKRLDSQADRQEK